LRVWSTATNFASGNIYELPPPRECLLSIITRKCESRPNEILLTFETSKETILDRKLIAIIKVLMSAIIAIEDDL